MIKKVYLLIFVMVATFALSSPVLAGGLKVAPAGQSITFGTLNNQNFGVADFNPGATASSSLAVTYTSSNLAVATIVAGKIHVVGVGTSVITASQAGDGVNFTSATDVAQMLTVNPVITFPALGSKQFSATNLSPGASTNYSGTAITYSSSDPDVATIIANQIHFVGLGTCTITATQAGVGLATSPYTPFSVSSTLTVTKGAAAVLTFAAISRAFQTVDLDPAATSTYTGTTLPINYTSSDVNVATIVNNRIHFVGIGTANITATQAGYTNFADAAPKVAVLTVTAPVITFTTLPATKQVTTVDFDPAATSTITSALITYTSDNPLVATIVNNKIHYIGTGTANIVASQSAIPAPAPVSRLLTVSAPSITFPATLSKPFTNTDYDPAATSTITNVPVTYSSSNTAVATIILNKVHLVSTGVTQITASQGGIVTPDVTQTLTVTPGVITLAATLSKPLTNVDFDPAATSTIAGIAITYSSSNPNVAIIVQNRIRYIGTGVTTITASQGGILAPDANQQLTVTAGAISFGALGSKPYNTADLVPGATSTNTTVPVTYSSSNSAVATIINNNIHYNGIGATTITATQGGIVPDVANVLTVTQPTLTLPALGTKNFSATDLDPAAVSTLNTVPIVYTSSDPGVATIVNNKIHYVGPGITQITASQAGSGTALFNAPADVTQLLTVTAQPLITFTTSLLNKPFSSTDLAPGATSTLTSGNSPILYTSSDINVATIVNNQIHYVGVGSSVITASQAAVPGSVMPYNQIQQLTVTPAVITFNALGARALSTTDLAPGATSTVATTIAPITYTSSDASVATIVNNAIHYISPGTVTITASQNIAGVNYAALPVSQTLVVLPAAITFPLLGSKPLSTADLAPGATSTSNLAAITYSSSNAAVATIVNNAIHYVGVGVTTITASQGGVIAPDVSQVLIVIPAGITFPPLGVKPFNLTDLAPGASSNITTPAITYSSSDQTVATIVNNAIHYVGTGTTVITASQGGTVTADVSQPLTVVQPLISFPALGTKVFTTNTAGTDVAPGATSTLNVAVVPITYTSSNPSVATIVNGLIHYVGLGTTIITASQPAGTGYAAPFSQVSTLVVTQSTLTFATAAFLPFSATDATPAATSTLAGTTINYSSSNPAVVTIVNGKYHFNGLGTTTITASQTDPVNPVPAPLTQLLTVYQGTQTLTFTAFPANILYGIADFAPTATSNGDPITLTSSNAAVATIVNGLIHITGVGSTIITAALNPLSGNFAAVNPVTQTLNVSKGKQTISDIRIPVLYVGQADYVITNASSAGLPVDISVTNPSVVTLSGQNLKIIGVGTSIVKISQPGNNLYNAADTVFEVANVQHLPGSDIAITQALSPNGDGKNDFLYVDAVELYAVNHMVIVNRNGVKVYETDNYNNKDKVFTGKSSDGDKNLPEGTYFYRFDYSGASGAQKKTGYIVIRY